MSTSDDDRHHPKCGCPECHPEVWDDFAPTPDADLLHDGADPLDL